MEAINPNNQNPSNPFLGQETKIEKAISQKCARHPLINADLLHLKSNVKNAKICTRCTQEDKISSDNCLQIKDVLQASQDSDLLTYPVFNGPQLQLRQALEQNPEILDSDKKQIDAFFAELTKQILDQIEKNKQSQKLKTIVFEDIQQRFLTCWQQIGGIEHLKQILQSDNNEAQLVEFINNHIKNSESNTLKIEQIFNEFQEMKEQFSAEQPNNMRELIKVLLKQINFFEGTDKSPLPNDESKQYRYELVKKQYEVDQLQMQLNDCKTQIKEDQKTLQEERSKNRQLQAQNETLSNKISDQRIKVLKIQIL